MRWEGNRESSNVEDARGSGGGGGGFGFGGRSIGIGTIVIALVGGAIFGINPLTILDVLSGGSGAVPVQQARDRPNGEVRVHRAGRHRGRVGRLVH
jgi:predicted metalloprotease